MSSVLADILRTDPASLRPAPPGWVQPDCVLIDDRSAPTILRAFVDAFGPHAVVRRAESILALSTLDPDHALPHMRKGHDLLRAFALHHGARFLHLPQACADSLCFPSSAGSTLAPGHLIVQAASPGHESGHDSSGRFCPQFIANGSLTLTLTPEDLACCLSVDRVWIRRPRLIHVKVVGSFREGVMLHDLAIHLRGQFRRFRDVWLAIDITQCAALSTLPSRVHFASLLRNVSQPVVLAGCDVDPDLLVNLDDLEPLIECGAMAHRASEFLETPVRVYLGSCAAGILDDHRDAATILKGRRVVLPTFISSADEHDHAALDVERIDPADSASPTLREVFKDSGCDTSLLPGCGGCVSALADLMSAALAAEAAPGLSTPPTPRPRDPLYLSTSPAEQHTPRGNTAGAVPRVALASPRTAVRIALGDPAHVRPVPGALAHA